MTDHEIKNPPTPDAPRATVLGVVMARAGSKGLADKHTLPLLGRPVIDYTLEHVRSSALLTSTVVSSDSTGVLQLAARRGFDVLHRPPHLCTDIASVQAVMLHALDASEQSGVRFDAAVILYGNVAVRGEGVIDRAIQHWCDTRCDSVRTFCTVGKWHPAWMSHLRGDIVEPLRPGSIHRRQDLEPVYLHDGAAVVMSRDSLLRGQATPDDPHAMFGTDRRGVETQMGETIEIDHRRDLYWAEAVLREQQEQAP
ncbi:MAG: NTP transferase domain-containing protein [Burkholderiales bacterium]|nr:NTP transferase domain-containing protein [Phycisphaerae bacterium]